jgi:hypothetical protein
MKLLITTIAMIVCFPALAQTNNNQNNDNDILVSGIKSPYHLTAKQLYEAGRSFIAHQSRLAPGTILQFEIDGYRNDPHAAELRFQLISANAPAVALKIDANGRFSIAISTLISKNYYLHANRKAKFLHVSPLVMTIGTAQNDRRLGDLRLECEVFWAIERETTLLFVRGMVDMAGGLCTSRKIGFYDRSDRLLASAAVYWGKTVMPLRIAFKGMSYQAPVANKLLSNDARVRLTYQ